MNVLDRAKAMVDIIVKQTKALFDNSYFVDDKSKAIEALPVLRTRECDLLYKNKSPSSRQEYDLAFWRTWHMTESFTDASKPLKHPCSSS